MNTAEKEALIENTVRKILQSAHAWGSHQLEIEWPDENCESDLIEDFIEHLRKIPEKSC